MQKNLEALEELIKKKNPELHATLEPGVPDIYLEAEFGPLYSDLPEDLKAIWSWHNGQSQNSNVDFHPSNKEILMSADDSAETIETLEDSTEVGVVSSDNWQPDWVPFTQDSRGNHLCVSAETGKVFYFDRNESLTGPRYDSVREWLLDTISEYEKL